MPPVPLVAARRGHLVVCGEDALARRVIGELTTRYGPPVTVLLRSQSQGSDLAGRPVEDIHQTGQVRVIALRRPGADRVDWAPGKQRLLAPQDRIYVLAIRAGLSRVLARGQPARA